MLSKRCNSTTIPWDSGSNDGFKFNPGPTEKGSAQLSAVGIIANPAAGKDIRRIVAQGRFVPNHEKVNILKRVLAGLDAVGVERVLFMPDAGALGSHALQDASFNLSAGFVEMPVFHEELDTTRATREMREAGVECIVTLGGDGTNRAVAKECGDIPLVPISTGTNNVFPDMTDGTIAGLAAGVVTTGIADPADVTSRHTRLEVLMDGELRDIALVDLAVSTERFVGGRAVWDMTTIDELFLTRSESTNIGLSAIGAQLLRIRPDEQSGLHIKLGTGGECVLATVAPGLVETVEVAAWEAIEVDGPVVTIDLRPATIALDGERTFSIPVDSHVSVRLSANGPRVVDLDAALSIAAQKESGPPLFRG